MMARLLAALLGAAIPVLAQSVPSVTRTGDRITIVIGENVLAATPLEDTLERLQKDALRAAPGATAVDVRVAGADGVVRTLGEALREPPLATPEPWPRVAGATVNGALSGRRIALSPGHGYYWHSTLGWTTQRPLIDGLLEDIHTNEIVIRYLIPYLENLGAEIVNCRERGEITAELVVDNDGGAPGYRETGGWASSTGGYLTTYRWTPTAAATTATARWEVPLPAAGSHPVYVWYRAGGNRAPDATYRVTHAGGTDEVAVDQTRDDRTWVCLGDYQFDDTAVVELGNASAFAGRVVVADAVKVGGGMGSIFRGGSRSGRPRWQECSRYWAQFAGAPPSVYDTSTDDHSDDVTCRPRFAEWRGADAYLSLHTNAGGGTGTSSYIYSGGATAGSTTLQSLVQSQIVADIRAEYDPTWTDRGRLQANFGEVRLLSTMPGVLVELAFHDTAGSKDHRALHDPRFRRIAARAMARALMRYFQPGAPFAPEPPRTMRVAQDGGGGLRVSWDGVAGAAIYAVEQSAGGKGFAEVARTPALSWSTGPLPPGTVLSFRVRSWNSSGRSLPTEVLTAGTSHRGTADLLLVQGFDRLERTVKFHDNTFDYLARHGDAIRRAGEFSLGFDAASDEAVVAGRVALAGYRAVDWACGEESTQHETFSSAAQAVVAAYLQQGGRLLVSGAEIGWDLDAKGSAADRAFYRGVLGAAYVADDANTYAFRSRAGGVFAGLPNGTFDDGRFGTYDVDYADVIAPADGKSALCLDYATGGGAAIERTDGPARVVHLGFPLETVVDPDLRAAMMARALRFLLAPRELEAPAELALGGTAPLAIAAPGSAGLPYVLAASLATAPGIALPGGHLPLRNDGLFSASLLPGGPIFVGFQGVLDGAGRANAAFWLPNFPFLAGLELYFSGFTIAPAGGTVGEVLPWVRIVAR